nr:hypoxanthine phosphoribosyltransferase [Limnochorda pilosa]
MQEILIDEQQIARRVAELGEQISRDYAGRPLALICILRGAVLFVADLLRAIRVPVTIDFMAISSYGNEAHSSGVVRILKDLDDPIEGKDVLIVEDIIDSGLTLAYLLENLRSRRPNSLEICVLLDKQVPRQVELPVRYTGFTIPDAFVVGYGLDYAEKYRNLPYVGILRPGVYSEARR